MKTIEVTLKGNDFELSVAEGGFTMLNRFNIIEVWALRNTLCEVLDAFDIETRSICGMGMDNKDGIITSNEAFNRINPSITEDKNSEETIEDYRERRVIMFKVMTEAILKLQKAGLNIA
jgi:hypothetical protein